MGTGRDKREQIPIKNKCIDIVKTATIFLSRSKGFDIDKYGGEEMTLSVGE